MIIDNKMLEAVGLQRTHNTVKDTISFFEAIGAPKKIIDTYIDTTYPFYRLFSNYGTGVGETVEEMVGLKFTDMIPKTVETTTKRGNLKTIKNPVYTEYNKKNGKKASNYDWLANLPKIKSIEVKVIRAASGKPGQVDKLHEIPSLLEERALTYAEGSRSGNGSFQQTKAELFDYLLGVVVYADQADFYLVPSADIKSGKLKITNQHAGAILEDGSTNEGHLAYRDLDAYKFLSVYSEEEFLASDSLAKYIPASK